MGSGLADRLGELIELSASERRALDGLETRERTVRRGAVLLREHDRATELFVIRHGSLMSYIILPDGSRQILRFLFPGDLIATPALVYRSAPETLMALTESTVAIIDRAQIAALIVDHPRIAGLLLVRDQIERVALTDRMANLGRGSAKARICALLIGLRNCHRRLDASVQDSFSPCLTQEQIGDATGLTAVHVNRMLRQLEDEGLLARNGGRITFLNEHALARTAHHIDRTQHIDLGWLPPAR
ncbi:Crp/Fnr family transcriptional regulator [Sphingomonas aquatilis]|uniref:CRP-like cAMP-binding protein n=1 Tax=Sphingomonas aquatilis TaxID=93063 RepID=A0AAW3TPL8_9SPHN|nr:Crp/Fnr family transcriptional regulator [Sphingomonas aquatilis]MBB3875093.1 CRP-like cAMP-binding protein [Sphingomonas aquatilis]MCI4655346.1 Crp/Fnr family transcriptional regulator [Sphingomonas aquatilis]GEM73502.1 Crp/Fnr family transcriptional regulator [Sphingomonas aquatilis NBRC 16722]